MKSALVTSAVTENRQRIRAVQVSLGAGLAILAAKVLAFSWTGSVALKSDAIESSINCLAAGVALWALRQSNAPADREHPYGHGKFEHATAAFEAAWSCSPAW